MNCDKRPSGSLKQAPYYKRKERQEQKKLEAEAEVVIEAEQGTFPHSVKGTDAAETPKQGESA